MGKQQDILTEGSLVVVGEGGKSDHQKRPSGRDVQYDERAAPSLWREDIVLHVLQGEEVTRTPWALRGSLAFNLPQCRHYTEHERITLNVGNKDFALQHARG